MAIKVFEKCCFVLPPVEFFQHEHAKEGVHLVACRTSVAVVGLESEVGHRKFTDELLNRVVVGMGEPESRHNSNIRF